MAYRYFINSEAGMPSWPSGKLTCSENPEYVSISLSSNETRQTRSNPGTKPHTHSGQPDRTPVNIEWGGTLHCVAGRCHAGLPGPPEAQTSPSPPGDGFIGRDVSVCADSFYFIVASSGESPVREVRHNQKTMFDFSN